MSETRVEQTRTYSRLYIGGEHVDSSDGSTFQIINPANQGVVAEVAKATPEDARAAVEAAQQAFRSWAKIPAAQRAESVFRAGELIRSRKDELARLLTIEEGKALRESAVEVGEAYKAFMYFAGEGRRLWSIVTPSEQPEKFAMTVRRPLGVVVVITPWNFPIVTPSWGIAPALVCGNTVVFKPASNTPLVAAALVDLLAEAGVPQGVINLITGPGGTVGETLLSHPDVKAVTFTGESATGKRVAEMNAQFLRRQVLELGGKNPLIVARDCELDLTVGAALFASFSNTGQRCTCTSRIIVEKPLVEAFTRKFVDVASGLRVGNGLHPHTEMGPVVSQGAFDKIHRYIDIGVREGAKLLTGGYKYTDSERSRGFFIPPTVFGDVSNDMKIAQDEIFGPVVGILEAANIDDAIAIANDTRYGLSSAIYTKDIQNAYKAIEEIDAGVTFINQGTSGVEVGASFGGVKDSGYGRELGEAAIDHFTEKKTVYIDYSYARRPWFFPWESS